MTALTEHGVVNRSNRREEVADPAGGYGRFRRSATSSRRLLRSLAFTLIEMLVVIGVIGILAAMVVGVATLASRNKIDKRVEVELGQLATAIENYKAKKGFYPPSNPTNETMAPLFYELLGTRKIDSAQVYETLDKSASIPIAEVPRAYGVSGFINSTEADAASSDDPDSAAAETFHSNLKPAQTQGTNRVYLGFPYRGPEDSGFTRWRYNSTDGNAPVSGMRKRNREGYDLWIELVVGGKTNIYGNWK